MISEALSKIKLGGGLVGNTTYVALAAVLALGSIGLASDNDLITGGCAVLLVAVAAAWFFSIMRFARDYPAAALLQGADYIHLRQIEMGAKELPVPPITINTDSSPAIRDITGQNT